MSADTAVTSTTTLTAVSALPLMGPVERPITSPTGKKMPVGPGGERQYVMVDASLNGESEPKANQLFTLTWKGQTGSPVRVVFSERSGPDLYFVAAL